MIPEFESGAAIPVPPEDLAAEAAMPNVLPFPLAASGAGG
jgi:hypothetical protein